MRSLFATAILIGWTALAPVSAWAQSTGPLSSGVAADFEVRISRLEEALREMTGKYEDAELQVSQLKERLDKLSADVDLRFGDLEAKANGGGPPPKPGKAAAAPPPPAVDTPPVTASLPSGGVQEQYDYAWGLLGKSDYASAEAAFSQFLTQHPNDPLANNARYWLGETYFVRDKYKEAATVFAEGYQKAPKGGKAPDNLLKLALSLDKLGKPKESCLTLAQLTKDFGDAPASIKRRADQERAKLNCS